MVEMADDHLENFSSFFSTTSVAAEVFVAFTITFFTSGSSHDNDMSVESFEGSSISQRNFGHESHADLSSSDASSPLEAESAGFLLEGTCLQ